LAATKSNFRPCTPAGIQEMIVRAGVETKGAEVVVVGRSNIVGKPIANMMLQKAVGANSTVTIVHTGTKDLAGHCKRADILIVAAGVPGSGQTRVDQTGRLRHRCRRQPHRREDQ
jgi:methylenetetrahydrofolate dehydrogenase (NADP+)/methenyltetrahydrofolate cyclohydrolase